MSRPRGLLLIFLALLAACGGKERVQTAQQTAAVVDDGPRDGGTLIRRLEADITTLNPIVQSQRYDRLVAGYLYSTMLRYDQNLKLVPGLAESWDISEDGKVYTFKLNAKATFTDGTPVRASDVVFSLARIVSDSTLTGGSFQVIDLANTRAVDDRTVVVTFREVLATQLSRFTDVFVVPQHVYGKGNFANDHNDVAVGSGPYRLVRRIPGREIVIERRPDLWDEPRPHIQTVVFKVITDHSTAWNALKRGEIDETYVTADTWQRERNNPTLTRQLEFIRFYTLGYNFIAWNSQHEPLGDKRVRRALAMTIPMEAIVQDLYHGTARAMTGPFTPDEWAYNPTVPAIRYDPDGAKQELAALGWIDSDGDGVLDKGGKPFKFTLLLMEGSASTKQFAQIVESEMKRAGIDVELMFLDTTMAIQRITTGKFEAAYLSWELDPEPDPFNIFHSSQLPGRGQNFVYLQNPEVDRLIDAARRELDQSKRKEIYWRLHEVLVDEQPYTWTVQVSSRWVINRRVRGVTLSRAFGLFNWHPGDLGWWLAPEPSPTASRQ